MLAALKRNDEVVTTGGLLGKVIELGDKVVTLEIAPNVRVRVERSQITAISSYGKPRLPRKRNSIGSRNGSTGATKGSHRGKK